MIYNIIKYKMDIDKMDKSQLLNVCLEFNIPNCNYKNKSQLKEIIKSNLTNTFEIKYPQVDLLSILNKLIIKYNIKILSQIIKNFISFCLQLHLFFHKVLLDFHHYR